MQVKAYDEMTAEQQFAYRMGRADERRDLLANGPDYEAAAQAIYDYGLPTATHDKQGRRVPFDRAMMTDSFRQAARAAVDAAIGDRTVYPKEAENGVRVSGEGE